MTYDGANRLETETITDPEREGAATTYGCDDVNDLNTKRGRAAVSQGLELRLKRDEPTHRQAERSAPAGKQMKSTALSYDANGNSESQVVNEFGETKLSGYAWVAQDRLSAVIVAAGELAGVSGRRRAEGVTARIVSRLSAR
jgi:hypothetical protein